MQDLKKSARAHFLFAILLALVCVKPALAIDREEFTQRMIEENREHTITSYVSELMRKSPLCNRFPELVNYLEDYSRAGLPLEASERTRVLRQLNSGVSGDLSDLRQCMVQLKRAGSDGGISWASSVDRKVDELMDWLNQNGRFPISAAVGATGAAGSVR